MSERPINPENVQKVEELCKLYESFDYTVVAEFTGVNVSQIGRFRKLASESSSCVVVTKNSINRLAAVKSGRGEMSKMLKGQNITVFTNDVVGIAKLVCDTEVTGLRPVVCSDNQGNLYPQDKIIALSKIPPLPVLQATLLSTMSSVSRNLLYALSGTSSSLVRVLQAYVHKSS